MKTFFGRFQGAIEVGALGMRDFTGGFAGGRIDHDQLAAGGGVGPCAIDVKLHVWIHGRLLNSEAQLYTEGYGDYGRWAGGCQAPREPQGFALKPTRRHRSALR